MATSPALGAREVYQLLWDVAQGVRTLRRLPETRPAAQEAGLLQLDIDGWQLTLYHEHHAPQHCTYCRSPDGREGSLQHWQRSGTDPVALLSVWEHRQIEERLKAL